MTCQVRQVLTEAQPARIPISSPGSLWPRQQPQNLQTLPVLRYCQGSVSLLLPDPKSCGCHQPQAGRSGWCPASQLGQQHWVQLKGSHWLVEQCHLQPRCPHQCDHPQSSCGEILQCLIHLSTPQDDPHIHKALAFFNTEP